MSSKYERAITRYNVKIVNQPKKTFYVYQYSLENIPFYVGIGTGQRYLSHLVKSHSILMERKLAKLQRLKVQFEIKIIFHTVSRDRALAREVEAIQRCGLRGKGGTLLNLTEGGDGGNTIGGKLKYFNPKTNVQSVYLEGTQPKGWVRGMPKQCTTKGYLDYHNPVTNEGRRLAPGEKAPKGFIKGRACLGNTGPKGKIILSNPTTGEHRWVAPDTKMPKGWVRGRSHVGSTKGRAGYHDPKTGQKKYLAAGEKPPRGWVKGLPVVGGKPIKIGEQKFLNIQEAVDRLKVSRYKLMKRSDFQFIG